MDFQYVFKVIPVILKGLPNTLLLTFFSMIVGLVLGFLLALVRLKRIPVLSQAATVFISFIRGVPLYVLIFLSYYTLPLLLKRVLANFGIVIKATDISAMSVALMCFTLFTSVYLSEVVRGALLSVNMGQMEAAYSIGMTELRAYIHIIIPQAVISAIPNYANLFVLVLKSTSLVFAISVADIMAVAKTEAEFSFHYLECYGIVAGIYLLLCILLSVGFKRLEVHFKSRMSLFQG